MENEPQELIIDLKECPACFGLTPPTPKVTFRRINFHEMAYRLMIGYKCECCGYLIKQLQIL